MQLQPQTRLATETESHISVAGMTYIQLTHGHPEAIIHSLIEYMQVAVV